VTTKLSRTGGTDENSPGALGTQIRADCHRCHRASPTNCWASSGAKRNVTFQPFDQAPQQCNSRSLTQFPGHVYTPVWAISRPEFTASVKAW
jgi:hypothetical protein